jgi:diadenosine tetraphosphate (Ap4A) HIT family hydrolase
LPAERHILMEEISLISEVMVELFQPDKLNVAALGNIVPQLHVHIIARFKNDPAWPEPVFGKAKESYSTSHLEGVSNKLKLLIANKKHA